jgi:tetratricopeptide (TPR) repeat protein
VDAVLQELNAIATPSGGTAPHTGKALPWRSPRLRGLAVWAGVAAVLVGLTVAGTMLANRTPGRAVDAQVIAVFPFRVTSSEPSLAYLQEAMADLLSMKLAGDSGMRASDLRAVISAWKRAGGGDLSSDQLKAIARELGAGQIITGEVVGTKDNLVISATLSPVRAGAAVRRTVQGSPDSISAMVDVLTAQLLSLQAGEAEERLATLTKTPLPALRAYLEGLSEYRRGNYHASRQAYLRALSLDPNFLQAIVGLTRADGWSGNTPRRDSLRAVAWRRRDELSRVDRLLIASEAGELTPGFTPAAMRLAAAQRATQVAWDNVDAWSQLADLYFHVGVQLGHADAMRRALAGFNRALAIDSTFRPASDHLPSLYHVLGDTAGRRRAAEHLVALDSASGRAQAARWFHATAVGDQRTLRSLRIPEDGWSTVLIVAANTGIGFQFVDSMWKAERSKAVLPDDRRGIAGIMLTHSANAGRPRLLSEDFNLLAEDTRGDNRADIRPLFAMFWDADSADGARGAAAIRARWASAPMRGQGANRRAFEMAILALWSLEHARREDLALALSQLRELASLPDTAPGKSMASLALSIADAWQADRDGSPDAESRLVRMDSVLRQVPGNQQMVSAGNLVSARLWERRGNPSRALEAVRRREWFLNVSPYFLSTMLREEGRLAEAAGDREGAIRAYEHYLALRFSPEPSLQADADRARSALERLRRESAGR